MIAHLAWLSLTLGVALVPAAFVATLAVWSVWRLLTLASAGGDR